jgi:hypothetical protein
MQEHRLMVQPDLRLKSKRTPAGCKPKPTKPNGSWVIIMTKELVQSFVWVYIVVVLDGNIMGIVGYHTDSQSTACHWLAALARAVN